MFKKNALFSLLFSFILSLTAQEKVQLLLSTKKDSIHLGEEVFLKLSLLGIESDLFQYSTTNKESIFYKMFDTPPKRDSSFSVNISLTPNEIGEHKIGPYAIKLFDKEILSNTVDIYVRKQDKKQAKFSISDEIKTNQVVELKFSGIGMNHAISLVPNSIYESKGTSASTTYKNGKMSHTFIIKIVFFKKGSYTLSRNWFKGVPDYVTIDPIELDVQKGKKSDEQNVTKSFFE